MVVMLFPVYVVVRVAYLVARRRKPDWSREPLSGVCAAYGIALLSQTLLPHGLYGIEDLVLFSQSLSLGGYHSYNIVPFHTISAYLFTQNDLVNDWSSVAFLNLLANVALFAPLGPLSAAVSKRFHRFRNVVLLAVSASLSIEVVQFFIGRSADIDDVILNVIGVCIGWTAWSVFHRIRSAAMRIGTKPST